LDKFESRSLDRIFLGYTPYDRSYRVLNLETNIIVELCDVTFDKTAPCPHDVFESVGDKEIEENIFIDEELHGFKGDEDEHVTPASTSSPRFVPTSTLEAEAPQAATSSSAGVQVSGVEREINAENGAPTRIQKAHLSQQIVGNLNERVTWSLMLAYLSCFTSHYLFLCLSLKILYTHFLI
jgi:hypothetical protein